MQRLLSIALSCLFAVTLSAQEPSITYPYNPDSNTDSLIGASDLVDFLPFYGEEFTPEPLTIEGMSAEEWMEQQTSSSGGGCDYRFPDGLSGEFISIEVGNTLQGPNTTYTVPLGKTYYISNLYNWSNGQLLIDGKILINTSYNYSSFGNGDGLTLKSPILIGEGQTISCPAGYSLGTNGLLIESNIEPMTIEWLSGNQGAYTVPNDKIFCITNVRNAGGGLLYVDDVILIKGYHNQRAIQSGTSIMGVSIGHPILVGPNQIIHQDGGELVINGYLADEGYFSDCGGGGGGDISGLQEQIDAVAADSYAADAALLTASDNADGELQAQIDANEVADQIESQAGSEADALLLIEINQNKSEVETEINLLQSGLSDNYTSDVQESINRANADAELQAQIDALSEMLSFIHFGCTNPTACNYDENALIDNGSCQGVYGCTSISACNYNLDAQCDDGSCWYADYYYDCEGNCLNDIDLDGVCDELEIYGCTDQSAANYNYQATEDDGTCDLEPYVGMCGFGGVVYRIDGNKAYIVNVDEEHFTSRTLSNCTSIVNSLATNGYMDWQIPNETELDYICSQKSLIDSVANTCDGSVFFGSNDAYVSSHTYCNSGNNGAGPYCIPYYMQPTSCCPPAGDCMLGSYTGNCCCQEASYYLRSFRIAIF